MDENTLSNIDDLNQLIAKYIEDGQTAQLIELLGQYHPADIADALDTLPPDQAVIVFDNLDIDIASEVLDETGSLVRQELVEKVDDERLASA